MIDGYSVYEHIFPNGKRYIGISKQAEKRWRNGDGYHAQTKVYKAIQHYGWENVKHNIIVDGVTKEQAEALEKYLIAAFDTIRNGYNITTGGEGINKGYLSPYVLSMIRYAKHNDVDFDLVYEDGTKILLSEMVSKDRSSHEASEFWNEAARAVVQKHGRFSATSFEDVREFWWCMGQYYLLSLDIANGKDVSNWEEKSIEDFLYEHWCKAFGGVA
jgi:hypothetical protein